MIRKKIAKKIKLERIKRGWSQEYLAFESNLSTVYIWKIETGKVSPTVETLEKLTRSQKLYFKKMHLMAQSQNYSKRVLHPLKKD